MLYVFMFVLALTLIYFLIETRKLKKKNVSLCNEISHTKRQNYIMCKALEDANNHQADVVSSLKCRALKLEGLPKEAGK